MGAAFNALMEDCTKERLAIKCCELMDEVCREAAQGVEASVKLKAAQDAAAHWEGTWTTATMYTRAQRDVADGLRRERDALLEQVRGLEKLQAQAWVPPKPSGVPV